MEAWGFQGCRRPRGLATACLDDAAMKYTEILSLPYDKVGCLAARLVAGAASWKAPGHERCVPQAHNLTSGLFTVRRGG